jgi:hypothetical protein
MPTSNPRINVTLSSSLDALVLRMARSQRVSKSQVLRELLEAAEPALQRAVTLMEAATAASAGLKDNLRHQLDRGQDAAEDALAVILSRMDRATRDLVTEAEAIQGKRPARGRARAEPVGPVAAVPKRKDPPASNRGVKSPPNGKTGGKRVAAPQRARRS